MDSNPTINSLHLKRDTCRLWGLADQKRVSSAAMRLQAHFSSHAVSYCICSIYCTLKVLIPVRESIIMALLMKRHQIPWPGDWTLQWLVGWRNFLLLICLQHTHTPTLTHALYACAHIQHSGRVQSHYSSLIHHWTIIVPLISQLQVGGV